jgi:small subunit ribosomal protein S2
VTGGAGAEKANAAKVAEVVAAQTPTAENDADAVVAEHEAAADATIVPEHAPESDAETEAKIEAEATDAEKKPAAKKATAAKKPAAAKPAAKK